MTETVGAARRGGLERIVRVLWCAAVLVVASAMLVPGSEIEGAITLNDKLLHFTAFFGLGILGGTGWPARRVWFLIGLPLLGVVLECIQGGLIAGRAFDAIDIVANTAGAVAGVAASLLSRRMMFKDP